MSKQPDPKNKDSDVSIAFENHDRTLFRSALIDEHGREVPITRDMIRRACDKFEANTRNLTYALLRY